MVLFIRETLIDQNVKTLDINPLKKDKNIYNQK
jgi:hypothetical protein